MPKNKNKADDERETVTIGEEDAGTLAMPVDANGFAFPVEEAGEVDINAAWLAPVAGATAAFVPLRRSGDVRHAFPPKDPTQKNDKPKYVWACQLCGPAVLLKGQEEVQGRAGDLFFLFEPAHPGIKENLAQAAQNGFGLILTWRGKVPRFVKSLGRKTDVWDIGVRLYARPVPVVLDAMRIAIPGTASLLALPERVTEVAQPTE